MKTRTLIIGFIFIVLFDLLFTSFNENENTEETKAQELTATIECKVDDRIVPFAIGHDLTTMPTVLPCRF